MAKRKNLKVGTEVIVKGRLEYEQANSQFCGQRGVVRAIEPAGYVGYLTIHVEFETDDYNDGKWYSHKDLKLANKA